MLDTLSVLVPVLLAISLASERLVTIIKTIFPGLKDEKKTDAGDVDLEADRPRQLGVQFLAILTSYATVGLAFSNWSPLGTVAIGGVNYSVGALALLGSGGSAFWNNILGYTKAVKDVTTAKKAALTSENRLRAEQQGLVSNGSGIAVLSRQASRVAASVPRSNN